MPVILFSGKHELLLLTAPTIERTGISQVVTIPFVFPPPCTSQRKIHLGPENEKSAWSSTITLKNAVGIKLPPQRRKDAKENQGFE